MERFRFNVFNRTGNSLDEEGSMLDGVDAARRKAIDSIRSIIRSEAAEGMIDLVGHIEVLDDAGNCVLDISFVEAFELHLPGPE
ncbi:hypothetical protein ABS767_15645 [Sphingomonas sp. ST-64]|uniref:DUF6894 domain-containing protein n=1 Tax=Sphingomonas plantiphila TaxID=3163295 RepID=A0ABW8YQV4_9SPHN